MAPERPQTTPETPSVAAAAASQDEIRNNCSSGDEAAEQLSDLHAIFLVFVSDEERRCTERE